MPLYEYECAACGHRFELIQRFSDAPAEKCTACGAGPVHKLLSAPAIQFKGTGWYVTDYGGRKGDSAPAEATKSDSPKTDAAPAAPSTESKPASDKPSSST